MRLPPAHRFARINYPNRTGSFAFSFLVLLALLAERGFNGWTLALFFYSQNRRLLATRNVLRSSEEQFRFIAEHAGDLVCVLTPEHRFRYASPSYRDYFDSLSVGEGRDWLDLVHPEDRQSARGFLEGLRDASKSRRTQLRIVPSIGSWRVVECVGNPVHGSGDELRMIVLVCRDLGRWLDAINSDTSQSQRAKKSG